MLAKADSQALADYLNLTFQKRVRESRHTPATTQGLYHQARVGNSDPRSHLWVPVLCAHFPFVLPEPGVNSDLKGQSDLSKAPGNPEGFATHPEASILRGHTAPPRPMQGGVKALRAPGAGVLRTRVEALSSDAQPCTDFFRGIAGGWAWGGNGGSIPLEDPLQKRSLSPAPLTWQLVAIDADVEEATGEQGEHLWRCSEKKPKKVLTQPNHRPVADSHHRTCPTLDSGRPTENLVPVLCLPAVPNLGEWRYFTRVGGSLLLL